MPPTVAVLVALLGVMLVGAVVFFTGLLQAVIARRRESGMRAPLIASGVAFVSVPAAATVFTADASAHLTFKTISSLRGSGEAS